MKKLISLVLSVTMVIAMLSGPVYGRTYTEAQICEEIGMLEGEGYGITETYLLKNTTRLQAAIMYLRLLGLEDEALLFEEGLTFDDANTVQWEGGRRILSYLKNNPDLGWVGMSDGSFAPYKELTAQEYYKVMLEALGYNEDEDFSWSEVFAYAHMLGLGVAKNVTQFTNNDVAIVTVEVLQAEHVSGDLLIDRLVGQGLIELEKAMEVGLVKTTPNDHYVIEFFSSDADMILPADGISSVTVTATFKDKESGELIEFDGLMEFEASLGTLPMKEVTIVDGRASVVIYTPDLDEDGVGYLTATVKSSNSVIDYKGLTSQLKITYSPSENYEYNNITPQSVISVESNQCDRFFVRYTGVINANAYKQALIDEITGINTWEVMISAGTNAGIFIDGQPIYIEDIRQKSENTLEFILNTDSPGSVAPITNRIRSGWVPTNTLSYLQDNTNHTFYMPQAVGNVVYSSGGSNFIVTDTQKPYVYDVETLDSKSLIVKFSESMAEDAIETSSRGVVGITGSSAFFTMMPGHNPNILINGKNIYLVADVNGASEGEIAFASANNLVLVRNVYVGKFDYATQVETRDLLYIDIDESSRLPYGFNSIQLANMKDWAGMTDITNVTTTQTIDFNVIIE